MSCKTKLIRCIYSFATLLDSKVTEIRVHFISLGSFLNLAFWRQHSIAKFFARSLAVRKIYSMSSTVLPLFIQGEVVKGFGRGSKELGCPTANYALEVVQSLPKNMEPGVYYGWAQVNNGPVHKMVANVGWCPFYANKQMSVETHIMHKFQSDFYGSNLKICLLGYLRGEKNFDSLDSLIEAIKQDIANAENCLESSEAQQFQDNEYFLAQNK